MLHLLTRLWNGSAARPARLTAVAASALLCFGISALLESRSGLTLTGNLLLLLPLAAAVVLYMQERARSAQLLFEQHGKIREIEARHAENARLLETTLAHMYQGLVVVGSDGNVIIHNKRAEEYSGVRHDEFEFPVPAQKIFQAQWKNGEFGRD